MIDLPELEAACRPEIPARSPATPVDRSYAGPERRLGAPPIAPWHVAALDEIDYGVLLLDEHYKVIYSNHAARTHLAGQQPLQLSRGELQTRAPRDAASLRDALVAASLRGLRKLLTLGDGAERTTLAIVPLARTEMGAGAGGCTTLVLLSRQNVCQMLSVEGFARTNGLTAAETRVLLALHDGRAPVEAAQGLGVAISTIRSQILSIRMKTGANSIADLVRQVAMLPPMVGALRENR